MHTEQVDGVYVANVADQKAEPELKLLGGLQAVLFNIHVCHHCVFCRLLSSMPWIIEVVSRVPLLRGLPQ